MSMDESDGPRKHWPTRKIDETLDQYAERVGELKVVGYDHYTHETNYAGFGWHGPDSDE